MPKALSEKLYACSSCPKSFDRTSDLKRHKNIHSGYRPHVCSTCGAAFGQKSGLSIHMNKHTGAKPYLCGIGSCQSAFGDPSSCARHRKEKHELVGSYRCPRERCPSRIKRRSAFVQHLKKHGIDPRSIDIDLLAPHKNRNVQDDLDQFASWYFPNSSSLPIHPHYAPPPQAVGLPCNQMRYPYPPFVAYLGQMHPNLPPHTVTPLSAMSPLSISPSSSSPSPLTFPSNSNSPSPLESPVEIPDFDFESWKHACALDMGEIDSALCKLAADRPTSNNYQPDETYYTESFFNPQANVHMFTNNATY